MYWKHYILIFFIALIITIIEIFLDFFKGYEIAYRSRFFIYLFCFNNIIASLLFFLNTDGGLKFLSIKDQWLLALVTGSSGFFLFNSKLDANRIEKNHEWSGIKSIISGIKTRLSGSMRDYVEKDYPFKLILYLKENINNVKGYSDFVNDAVDQFADKDKKSKLFKLIKSANHMESDDKKKIYYLTKVLMEIKDTHWIKRNVSHKFCKNVKK